MPRGGLPFVLRFNFFVLAQGIGIHRLALISTLPAFEVLFGSVYGCGGETSYHAGDSFVFTGPESLP